MRIARRSTQVCTTSGSSPASAQQLAAAPRLGLALVGEVDVDPAGEEVLRVPLALAVPEQHQGRGDAVQPARGARAGHGAGPERRRGLADPDPVVQLAGGRGGPGAQLAVEHLDQAVVRGHSLGRPATGPQRPHALPPEALAQPVRRR